MNIVRDNGDQRPTRVARMIQEFRTAQSRRLAKATTVKGDDQLQRDAPIKAVVARSIVTSTSHGND